TVSIERSGISRILRPFARRYSVTPSTEVTRATPAGSPAPVGWAKAGRAGRIRENAARRRVRRSVMGRILDRPGVGKFNSSLREGAGRADLKSAGPGLILRSGQGPSFPENVGVESAMPAAVAKET